MELEKRFTISDSFVTILCLLGFLYSISLFNGVLNQSLDKINEAPIGTITFKYKSAQRKLIDRVLWDRVKQNSPVYNGDIIRTAELSEATITFVDGNIIELYEQTLAQVFLDLDEGTAIDFSGGGVSLNTNASANGLTLTSGSANVQVAAGAILNAASPLENDGSTLNQLSLQMQSGQAELTSTDGEAISLNDGNGLVYDTQTNSFLPPNIKVLSPSMNTKYLTQSSEASIPFSWEKESIASNEYIILETSQNKDFNTIYEQISFTNVSNISLNIPEGTWYWRLYTQSQSTMLNGKVQVLSSPVPTATVPATGSEFSYRTKKPQIRFMWNDDEYARSWLFTVAENEQLQNPVISQTTTQPSAIVNTLEAGKYYWNVTPIYSTSFLGQENFQRTTSEISFFDVVEQGELTQAELILPINGGFIDASKNEEGQHFTWKYDYEAAGYEIIISKNNDLSNPIVADEIRDNFYVLYPSVAELSSGEWFWAVTKIDSEGTKSLQSSIRSLFSVEGRVEQRTLFPPDGYNVAENLVLDTTFTWKTNLPFAMKFQIAKDDSFTEILEERISYTSSVSGLNIPVGTWYWRIIADTSESNIPYETDSKMFSVSPYLEKVLVNDMVGETEVVVRPSIPMEFTWEEVEQADYYQVRLFHADNKVVPVFEDLLVDATSISIDMDDFEEGQYSLTLRAMSLESDLASRQTGLLSEQTFEMEKLEPITLLSPKNGYTLDGVEALENPPYVEWSSVELPYEYQLIVASSNFGLSLPSRASGREIREQSIYQTIENPAERVQLRALPAGTWYWSVIARTEEGFDITPLEAGRIIVEPIEPFSAPQVIDPPRTLVLNMDYLRKQRFIDINWHPIDEADAYILRISNDNDTVVVEETLEETTSYRFDNLAQLGRGSFSWSLEAIQRIDGNVIVRRGKREERELIIDIPVINAPKEQTTGELYGL